MRHADVFHIVIVRLLLCLVVVAGVAVCPAHGATSRTNAAVLKSKGDTCYRAYRYAEALDWFTQGMQEAKRENDKHAYAACLGSIGNVYIEIGDFKRSIYYNEAYEQFKEQGNAKNQMAVQANLVDAYCKLGDAASAKTCVNRMAPLQVKNVTLKQYLILICQGNIARTEGKYSVARYYLAEARDYARAQKMPARYITSLYSEIGDQHLCMGDTAQAVKEYQEGLRRALEEDDWPQAIVHYKRLSEVYGKQGNQAMAEEYNRKYLALKDSVFNQEQMFVAGSKLFDYENEQTRERITNLTLRNRWLWIVIGVGAAILALISTLYALLRRNVRHLREAQQLLVSKNEDLMAINGKHDRILQEYVSERQSLLAQLAEVRAAAQDAADDKDDDGSGDDDQSSAGEEALSQDLKNELLSKIVTVMSDVKVISNPDFSLAMLTGMVNSNSKYVSLVINSEYGKGFKQLLNECRIREACRRLTDHEHYGNLTIQAVYEELGFNNATSFITAFRKVTGMTPSRYKKLKE